MSRHVDQPVSLFFQIHLLSLLQSSHQGLGGPVRSEPCAVRAGAATQHSKVQTKIGKQLEPRMKIQS